jgi:hypothetical protein
MAAIFLFLIAAISIGATVLFSKYIGPRLKSAALRLILAGLVLIISLVIGICGSVFLLFSSMYPTTSKTINEAYSFTQRPYGFVTTPSNGYFLTFYRTHTFKRDEELGKINIECMGTEDVEAEIRNGRNNYNRLIIKLNNETKVDTMLHFDKPFNFKRSPYEY